MKRSVIIVLASVWSTLPAFADSMTFQFANPSFNGGPDYSDHILRLEQEEFRRKQAEKDAKAAAKAAEEAKQAESLLNKFLENVTSRIYATLSKKLVDAMFGDGGSNTGTVSLDGTTVEYFKSDTEIRLVITDPDGNVTELVIPIGEFNF